MGNLSFQNVVNDGGGAALRGRLAGIGSQAMADLGQSFAHDGAGGRIVQ
jgi:hypothetical protein